jgi:hypothetical protein
LVSFNIEPSSPNITDIFDGVGQDKIRDYRWWEWNQTNPQFTTWEVKQGFLVHIPSTHSNTSVNVTESSLFGPDSLINITPYVAPDTLRNDYNRFFISYLPEVSMPVDSAFKDLIGLGNNGDDTLVYWIRNSIGQFYIPTSRNSTKFLCHPGEGYDLNMTDDSTVHNFNYSNTTFTPDVWNGGGGKGQDNECGVESVVYNHFNYRICTQDIYPIIIDTLIVEGVTIENGDELGVFTSEDICCGAQILTLNQPGFILTAWEDDITTEEKDGFEWGEMMTFKFYDASLDTEYVIEELGCTINSANPKTEPIIADVSGPFGAGQYAVRSLVFDGSVYAIPNNYALHQNYPNPFNPITAIQYDLPFQSKVKLEIFNVLGQRVAVLVDGIQTPGYKKVIWNENEVASGLYICKFQAEAVENGKSFNSFIKMLLVK